jgi:hypothetical protein
MRARQSTAVPLGLSLRAGSGPRIARRTPSGRQLTKVRQTNQPSSAGWQALPPSNDMRVQYGMSLYTWPGQDE